MVWILSEKFSLFGLCCAVMITITTMITIQCITIFLKSIFIPCMVGQCREALGLSGTRWRHHPGRARRQSLIQRHLQPSCTVVRIQVFFNSHTSLVQNSTGIATPTIQYSLCYHYLPSRRSITQLWLAPISFNIHFV